MKQRENVQQNSESSSSTGAADPEAKRARKYTHASDALKNHPHFDELARYMHKHQPGMMAAMCDSAAAGTLDTERYACWCSVGVLLKLTLIVLVTVHSCTGKHAVPFDN